MLSGEMINCLYTVTNEIFLKSEMLEYLKCSFMISLAETLLIVFFLQRDYTREMLFSQFCGYNPNRQTTTNFVLKLVY